MPTASAARCRCGHDLRIQRAVRAACVDTDGLFCAHRRLPRLERESFSLSGTSEAITRIPVAKGTPFAIGGAAGVCLTTAGKHVATSQWDCMPTLPGPRTISTTTLQMPHAGMERHCRCCGSRRALASTKPFSSCRKKVCGLREQAWMKQWAPPARRAQQVTNNGRRQRGRDERVAASLRVAPRQREARAAGQRQPPAGSSSA